MTKETDYDVIIVGAGPAGLQAGISFVSDGTSALVVDKKAIGGQAGESALIENIMGLEGISGRQLADAGIRQMQRFGGHFKVPFEVQRITPEDDGTFTVVGDNRERISAKAVVLAPGVQYSLLEARNVSVYVNRGVNYGSPSKEPGRWHNKRVAIIGGANSAGQAAFFLADKCAPCEVHMLVRGPRLDEKMSTYMAADIKALENIHVHLETEVQEVFGDEAGFKGVIAKKKNGAVERMEFDQMLILIGAQPHTAWLEGLVELDKLGFIYTDRDLPSGTWKNASRQPYTYETSVPGIFAVGDAESSSVKRASAAIGNGSSMTPSVRRYLTDLREKKVVALRKPAG